MEHFAAVRLRTGEYSQTEKLRITGNVAGAIFFHDASRSLDPQLHAHLVLANASYDKERGQWLALQRRAMMRASPYVRQFLYHDFARRLKGLGYEINSSAASPAFSIAGVTKEMEDAYSQRALQRKAFENRYTDTFGHAPSKRRIEHFIKDNKGGSETRFAAEYKKAFGETPDKKTITAFVRDWRDPKLTKISTEKVREIQRGRLDFTLTAALEKTVAAARQRSAQNIPFPASSDITEAARMGLDHCLERASVVELGEALEAALKFGSKEKGDIDPLRLRAEMLALPGVISDNHEITTEQVLDEEARVLRFAATSRSDFPITRRNDRREDGSLGRRTAQSRR